MNFKDLSKAQMVGVITFIVITVCALLFSSSFSFLQNKSQSPDKDNKCPSKCCQACSLNLPLVLLFAGGLGVAAWLGVTFIQKENRDKLMAQFSKPDTSVSLE